MTLREIARRSVIAAGAALLVAPAAAAPASGWRSAIDRLAEEKTLAEGCAAILKSFAVGHPMMRVQGERLYARAKADADGLIALLVVDLADDRSPADIPEISQRLETVSRQRQTLCRHVDAAVGTTPGAGAGEQGARTDDLIGLLGRGTSGPDSSLIEAAGALWTNYRRADAAEREEMRAVIGAARWRPYALVPAP